METSGKPKHDKRKTSEERGAEAAIGDPVFAKGVFKPTPLACATAYTCDLVFASTDSALYKVFSLSARLIAEMVLFPGVIKTFDVLVLNEL